MTVKDRSTRFPVRSTSTFQYVGTPPPSTWDRTLSIVSVKTRDGVACPNWKTKISKHEDATTPLTAQYDTYFHTFSSAYFSAYYIPSPSSYKRKEWISGILPCNNGRLDRAPVPPSKSTSDADNGARAKWFKKLRETEVLWSAPTFLGELRETLHMLRKPTAALNRGLRDYWQHLVRTAPKTKKNGRRWSKNDNYSYSRELGNVASGLWLEYSFGWLPFLRDMEDAANAYDKIWDQHFDEVIRLNAGFRMSYDRTAERLSTYGYDDPRTSSSLSGGQDIFWVPKDVKLLEIVDVRYRGAVRQQVNRPGLANTAQIFGFNPLEFIPTAWELMPWSFLIDYATNIGDILTAVATNERNVVYCSRAIRQFTQYSGKLEVDIAKTKSNLGANWKVDSLLVGQSEWIYNRKLLSRSNVGSVPLPTLSLSWDFSDGQKLNVAALLGQAINLHPQRGSRRLFERAPSLF